MPPVRRRFDALDEVHELNRLFLIFLQRQAVNGHDCLGLPHAAERTLARALPADLDRAAELPRALFRVELPDQASAPTAGMPDARVGARHALQLTILHSVWNCCRQSTYHARAFFGLSLDCVRRLRMTPLSELPGLAFGSEIIACGFERADWLWLQLLTPQSNDSREQLALVALQPGTRPLTGRRANLN